MQEIDMVGSRLSHFARVCFCSLLPNYRHPNPNRQTGLTADRQEVTADR